VHSGGVVKFEKIEMDEEKENVNNNNNNLTECMQFDEDLFWLRIKMYQKSYRHIMTLVDFKENKFVTCPNLQGSR